jgi:hypothetical protein
MSAGLDLRRAETEVCPACVYPSGDIAERWRSRHTARPRPYSAAVQLIVRFDPPDAHRRFREWREQHAETLSTVPPDAIRVDTGRAVLGDFVRVSVAEAYAGRFASAPD